MDLERCRETTGPTWESIEFGDAKSRRICWEIKAGESILKNSQTYTDFFGKGGNKGEEHGNINETKVGGTQQCNSGDSLKWVIMSPNSRNGIQYLGLCGETEDSESLFVKKAQKGQIIPNEEQKGGSLGVCDNDCWERDSGAILGTPTTLQNEITSSGKEVMFYNQSE